MLLFILLFFLGISIGSFLNVLVDRLPREESFIKGRSYCESCKKELQWYDLIPLFSFIQIRGKCRYCRTPLSFYYPFIELTTGILFVMTFIFSPEQRFMIYDLKFKDIFLISYILYLISSLIVIFFADIKYGIIPDKIVFPAIIVSFVYVFINHYSPFTNHLLSAFGAFLLFLLIFLITKGKGMGFGDVKFVFLMGLILGFPQIIVALYVAFLTGAFVSCILILWGKKKLKGSTIPFGPFLVFGTFVSLFWGQELLKVFLTYFFHIS